MLRIRSLISGTIALALVSAACSTNSNLGAESPTTTTGVRNTTPLAAPSLTAFDACEPFLDYVIRQAVDLVGPYGLGDPYGGWWGFGRDMAAFEDSSVTTAAQAGGADGGQVFSGTNVQVEGVDEPDIVKTDGDRIVMLSEGTLIVVDVAGDSPSVVGRLHLGNQSVQSIFLSGDTVLLFGSAYTSFHPLVTEDRAGFAPTYQSPSMSLAEVDISGGQPELVRTMTIDGQFLSGRMVDGSVRIVSTSSPVGLEWSFPEGTGLRAEQAATERNREIVRQSGAENWIPYFIVSDADGRTISEGSLFDCNRATHPKAFSGLDMLSVTTIDISRGLSVVDSTGVLASGNTVYSSAENLYVATQNWETWRWAFEADLTKEPESVTTEIHKFDITDPAIANYRGTGTIEGYLLNQFAMDEHGGHLRVASTTRPNWWGSGFESESLVTVLEDDGSGTLETIGSIDGLGETEQIYSVRFMGDVGYVVTFRQTDPLYTIDLSDPSAPRVAGELKILGYSAYLHPVGEGLLLGVGRDATDEGRVEGTQVSLFDVSDPANPTKIDQITLSEGSNSEVEYNHHAFLYWAPSGLAVVPVQQWYWSEDSEDVFMGALGFEVGADSLTEVKRFSHPGGDRNDWDWRAQITRSIVIGDHLYTISAKGIMTSTLDGLDELDWLGF